MQIDTSRERARIKAVLGPTNTGKTHFAMERMLGHGSGMIGFPLRLLARENYERAVKVKGRGQVALITGEEKILPPGARYFMCTVEAMPVDRRVAFLAIDEVQMCADPDRGHIFTQRLLHARGLEETMFMGAETIRPLLERLVPEAEFVQRPRFSTLSWAGQRNITPAPPRTAVVAFSAADVYAIAELVRRQRGGTAVVLGALSPRTRNAQVDMYQSGDVDYLVATDAIGMGLNMDVDHVAFAATRKFDGRFSRDLTAPELAQIAGRAGRHMNDGTFGTTGDIGPIDPEAIDRIESHAFEPLRYLYWRNPDLRPTSVEALKHSLRRSPEVPGLVRAREADDEQALDALVRDEAIRSLAQGREAVELLWEVCQVPDFRKVMSDAHARLLARLYRFLMAEGRLPTDWVADHVKRLDRLDGDIETLMQRIAHIRTWTYVSHRGDWLADAQGWQEKTRAIEDRLSDALHERLTARFVDRRTSVLLNRLKDKEELLAAVTGEGAVLVEGEHVGHLEGLRYVPDRSLQGPAARTVANAAMKALRGEIETRVHRLEADDDSAFALTGDAAIAWHGHRVARLAAGPEPLAPAVEPLDNELLQGDQRERLRKRLADWLDRLLAARLGALFEARRAPVGGPARGLVFQLCESLGSLPRQAAGEQVAALTQDDRRQLRACGIRIGRHSVFAPALLKPATVALRALLWCLSQGAELRPPPPPGRVSVAVDAEAHPPGFLEAVGYRPAGPVALRIDILERVAARLWSLGRKGPFALPAELLNLAGCGPEDMAEVVKALGYRRAGAEGETPLFRAAGPHRRKPRTRPHQEARRPRVDADHPFAKLRHLQEGR